jgi:hypothetical protein
MTIRNEPDEHKVLKERARLAMIFLGGVAPYRNLLAQSSSIIGALSQRDLFEDPSRPAEGFSYVAAHTRFRFALGPADRSGVDFLLDQYCLNRIQTARSWYECISHLNIALASPEADVPLLETLVVKDTVGTEPVESFARMLDEAWRVISRPLASDLLLETSANSALDSQSWRMRSLMY